MQRCLREILEDEHHIELFQAELHALQGSDLDIGQCHDEERRVRQMHQALRRRLQAHICPERHTLEGKFAEWNVRLQSIAGLQGECQSG